MNDTELDRSEAATPWKLHKAREQGQAARSPDLAGAAVFLVAMTWVAWQGMETAHALLQAGRATLAQAARLDPAGAALWPLAVGLAGDAALALLPFFLAVLLAATLGNVAQTGFLFAPAALRFDWNRVNPAQGLQRLFSLRTLFDGARACIKLVVLVTAAVLALRSLLPQFHAIAALPAPAFLRTLVDDVSSLGLRMALALLLVALLDVAYSRREFARRMRMSRRELKDEYRNREGDPRIRARLRELRREMLKRSQALVQTRTATVVLANPTHFAVALRYVHGEMAAPRVVAKGAGQLALAMREIAARHRVVVVENPPLARRLFREAPLDADLPADFHAEVARIIVWVLASRQQRATGVAA
jgi:flagellar biosynthetic protein FlhB